MATSAKKPATKRKPAAKRETKATQSAKKQMWAVVLFALGVLLAFLTFIPGKKLWLGVHNLLFGLMGWSAWFIAPLLIYIAVIAALDRPLSSIKAKLWQMGALILIISGAIQIFSGLPDEDGFAANLMALFKNGVEMKGGGVLGSVLAWPLVSLTDYTGAKIIIWLAIFVFIMLITGSTLISLYHTITKPVKDLGEAYTAKVGELHTEKPPETKTRGRAAPEQAVPPPAKTRGKGKFDIDVDISADTIVEFEPEPKPEPEPEDSFVPPYMPGHPIVSERVAVPEPVPAMAGDTPPWELGVDTPVEYITPDAFSAPEIPEISYETPRRAHPLEEDIERMEREGQAELESLLSRVQTASPKPAPFFDDEPVDVLAHSEFAPKPQVEAAARESSVQAAQTVQVVQPDPQPAVYSYPPTRLLKPGKTVSGEDSAEELKQNAQTLVDTLKSFGVQTRITDICRGPAVTRYELQPSAGVKISKITGLSDDIALNLATAGIRIEAPIPNKAAVGIEVPNKAVSVVGIRDIVDSNEFSRSPSSVTAALGKDIAGNVILADIGKMPHLLIAGSTGSGKSVCINSIIISLLYKSSPDDVKLLMVDPKVVELGIYNGIPHLLVPVVTDPKKAAGALAWAVSEMLGRYKTFAANSVRDLAGYNSLAKTRDDLAPMPKIVIIIDELADLMMAAPNEVEDSICRLAQMARAAGMHLIIATQRPSVDVITGVIKANIPSRIAFAVSSQVDSRTILDMGGAEKLLGRGDMLFYPVGASKPVRIQGCFVSDAEVEQVVSFIKEGEAPFYDQNIVEEIDRHAVAEKQGKNSGNSDGGGFADEDDMMPAAIECVVEAGQASTSQLQRRLKLGYARAARIIDQLEEKGIVGPYEGSKPRQVLISRDRWIEMKLSGMTGIKDN